MERILQILKKTKVTLKTYYETFSEYLERVRVHENDKVNEHIIRTTQQAIKGIFKYQTVVEDMLKKIKIFMAS